MAGNNAINAVTSSSGWTSFTTTITAVTTNPTQGAGATKTSYYLQEGKVLRIVFNYKQTAAGTAGSGTYLFSIPAGFTINTTVVSPTLFADSNCRTAIGSGTCHIPGTAIGPANPIVYDATRYAVLASSVPATEIVSNSFYALSSSTLYYSWELAIPIT